MADVFKRSDVKSLLQGKHVLFIGDSNIRALYKDLLWLYKINSLISLDFLKRRLENKFLGDRLVARSELTRGRDFAEHRIFEDGLTTFEFLFVTRCYCDSILQMVKDIKNGRKHCPDVIFMNSCLWDVSRWGPDGVREYKSNMEKLMKLLTSSLPKHVLFIWGTALPIAALTSGGLLIKEIEFLQAILRIHVIEANSFTASLVASYGYDVLDFHHYMRYQIIRRSADGIHFLPAAMRFLTNLLLTHIAISWDVKLPGNLKTWKMPLSSKIENAIEASANHEMKQMFKKIELLADTLDYTIADTPNSKKKKKKKKKKFQNLRVTHFKEPCGGLNSDDLQLERASMKTPPNYHKASPVFKRTVSVNVIQNNNFACPSNNGSDIIPSSSNNLGYNFQTGRKWNIGYLDNITFTKDDFHLGFGDFNENINSPECFNDPLAYRQSNNIRYDYAPYNIPERYPGYYNSNRAYPSQFQAVTNFPNNFQHNLINPDYGYYDGFSNHRNHPYKPSHDDRMAWRDADPYQNSNLGPMRSRRARNRRRR